MHRQYAIALEHPPSYAEADFLRNQALDDCIAQLTDTARWPEPVMLLVGPEACGKTHLMHVLGGTLLQPDTTPLDAAFKPNTLHIIEDVDRHEAPDFVAQAINHARAQKLPLLLTSRTHPGFMQGMLPDLQSRLKAATQMAYPNADDALLEAVMAKRFSDLQWRVAPEVIRYLITRLPRSFAAQQAFIAHADILARQENRALTLPYARELLASFETGDAHA